MNWLLNQWNSLFSKRGNVVKELPRRHFIALDGIICLLPPEVLSVIMSYCDFKTIIGLVSINLALKVDVQKSVTQFIGDCNAEKLLAAQFLHLREVFGIIRVKNLSTLDRILDLDLSTFTVGLEVPYQAIELAAKSDICRKISQLTSLKSVTIDNVENVWLLSNPPRRSKRRTTLISWNQGIVDIDMKWRDQLLSHIPFHGVKTRTDIHMLPYYADTVNEYSVDNVVMEYSFRYMSVFASGLLKINPQISSIICIDNRRGITKEDIRSSSIKGERYFCPEDFKGIYLMLKTLQIPIVEDQVPALLNIFPNIKNVTVFIKEGVVPDTLKLTYPNITFNLL